MESSEALIASPIGVLAALSFVAAFFFMIEQTGRVKLFQYIPPLLFIYATPVFLNNFDVIPSKSPIYSGLSAYLLPAFIVLMLIKVNVPAVVKVMGKGVLVMLMGTAGVMVGGVVAYLLAPFVSVRGRLEGIRCPGRQLDWRHGEYGRNRGDARHLRRTVRAGRNRR